MEKHRIITAPSCDGKPEPHLFVEIEQDHWLEVKKLPTHQEIEKYVHRKNQNKGYILATTSYIRSWVKGFQELDPII